MRKKGRKFRANRSGQLFIIAALAIAILISSTTLYVYQLANETSIVEDSQIVDLILLLKENTRNAVMSSLANISNGGEKPVLTSNLNELSDVFRTLHRFGIYQLDFSVLNDSTYDSGTWLSWDQDGTGVSSAYANFTLRVTSMTTNVTTSYAVNVTTSVTMSGYYINLLGGEKLMNLTCKVYNEGEPALAKNISLFYEQLGSWMPVDSSNNLSITDYGNGTYTVSFTAINLSIPVHISAHVYDLRQIFVRANATCDQA